MLSLKKCNRHFERSGRVSILNAMEPTTKIVALVVEDVALIRWDACEILAAAGFTSLEAANVDEAIAILENQSADISLLLTDVQMPGTRNGFDLACEAAERWPHIKVLVASARAFPEEGELPAGVLFMNKPFSAETVFASLHTLLPQHQALGRASPAAPP